MYALVRAARTHIQAALQCLTPLTQGPAHKQAAMVRLKTRCPTRTTQEEKKTLRGQDASGLFRTYELSGKRFLKLTAYLPKEVRRLPQVSMQSLWFGDLK